MSNTDAFAALDDMIERVENVKGLAKRAAPDAADAVRACLESTIKAGQDPYGKPWPARKEDGGAPLTGIAGRVKVVAIGARVFVAIDGYVGRHHLGRARGGVRRQVIPVGELPPVMQKRVRDVLAKHFREAVGAER
jgi:hypothetical protein